MELRTADGEMLALGSLRGEPLLLFLFTTYDDASQLALGALIEARRALGDLQVLGVALQPDAGPFLRAYGDALAVDFPLTYEPDATIVAGHSALGSPVSVPTFVLLDAEGHPVEVLVGVPKPGDLVEMVSAAHP